MAGRDVGLPDTSTRQKLLQLLSQFGPDVDSEYGRIRSAGRQSLQDAFGAAQADIGAQFSPAMRMAQARLGASPLLADSGYANRLNRQIQSAAFGDLSRRYAGAAADQSATQQSALERLIQSRLGFQQDLLGRYMSAPKKKNAGDYVSQYIGAAAGAAASAYGGGG